MGYSKARDEVKAKSQAIKVKAYENLNKTKKQNAEDLKNVESKISDNDFSSFNDD